MSKHKPIDVVHKLVKAVNQRDLKAAMACYENEAAFVVEPGQVVTGASAVREALNVFISMKTIISTEKDKLIQSGDLVLYSSRWSATGTAPDGSLVKMGGTSSDVLRRQADGRWLIVIDNPFGALILN